jgi:DNA mismatch repair protein MutS
VLARAGQVLAALEERARSSGQDALAEELPLFARGSSQPAKPLSAAEQALSELDPDALSPREAHEALYYLKSLAAGTSMPQHQEPAAEQH